MPSLSSYIYVQAFQIISLIRVAKFYLKVGSRRTTKIENLVVLVIILVALILLTYCIILCTVNRLGTRHAPWALRGVKCVKMAHCWVTDCINFIKMRLAWRIKTFSDPITDVCGISSHTAVYIGKRKITWNIWAKTTKRVPVGWGSWKNEKVFPHVI